MKGRKKKRTRIRSRPNVNGTLYSGEKSLIDTSEEETSSLDEQDYELLDEYGAFSNFLNSDQIRLIGNRSEWSIEITNPI